LKLFCFGKLIVLQSARDSNTIICGFLLSIAITFLTKKVVRKQLSPSE
jgi:hypothetical protein